MPSLPELVQLERRFWLEASEQLYREHMAADGLMAFSVGVLDKEQTIEAIAEGGPWAALEIDDPRAVELGGDAVALVYRASARREGQEPYSALATSVYVQRDGRLLLAVHQQTPLA